MIYQPMPIGRVCYICKEWKPRQRLVKAKRCKDGVSHMCLDCHSAKYRQYRKLNPERCRKYWRNYKNRHPEKEYKRNRQQKRIEGKKSAARKRRTENLQAVRDYHSTWKRNNPNKRRAYERTYQMSHPDKLIEKRHRRESRKRTLPSTFTAADWKKCLNYWSYRCAYCGRECDTQRTIAQDHFVAESKGGGYTVENIVPACHGTEGCNNKKRDMEPAEWLMREFGIKQANEITEKIRTYFKWAIYDHTNESLQE